jgi:hypothetical protein
VLRCGSSWWRGVLEIKKKRDKLKIEKKGKKNLFFPRARSSLRFKIPRQGVQVTTEGKKKNWGKKNEKKTKKKT